MLLDCYWFAFPLRSFRIGSPLQYQLKRPIFSFFAKVMHVHGKILENIKKQTEWKRKKKSYQIEKATVDILLFVILSFLHA